MRLRLALRLRTKSLSLLLASWMCAFLFRPRFAPCTDYPFLKRAAKMTASHGKYKIGAGGITVEQVSLLSVQNTNDSNWQATLYISV